MDRLTSLDASFLYIETDEAPLNIGTVAIFDPPAGGFDHERLVKLIRRRLAFVPRYRQRIKFVPLGIFRPVWVDDTQFDVSFHVRRSALPKPGTRQQLDELVARLMSRPLDRNRPLWEMYLIEGLAHGQFAIVTKSHEALVDGLAALDISQVILDPQPDTPAGPPDTWRPQTEPSSVELVSASVTEVLTRPSAAIDVVLTSARDVVQGTQAVIENSVRAVQDTAGALLSLAQFGERSPLKTKLGAQRRFHSLDIDLDRLRTIKSEAREVGIDATINDVILAVVTGAVRLWLVRNSSMPQPGDRFRALVPVSLETTGPDPEGLASSVNAYLIDLPISEFDPADRLEAIVAQMSVLDPSNEFMGAGALIEIAGFGPATMHALGARVASTLARRSYDITVTNVPGPQHELFASGSKLVASYPSIPLVQGQALSVGVTSYHGSLHVGLMSDRDAVADLALMAQGFEESVIGLLAALTQKRKRMQSRRPVGGSHLRVVND